MAAAAAEQALASSTVLLDTRHADAQDLPVQQLSELRSEVTTRISAQRLEPEFSNIIVNKGSVAHIGHTYQYFEAAKPPQLIPRKTKYGLCLGNSPKIDSALFQGRSNEIEKMRHQLAREDATGRRCLVLGGIGGIGKTQLALRYADCCRESYDSVFWINASTEATVNASFREIAEIVFDGVSLGGFEDSQIVVAVRQWLSDLNNQQWLLIYDNYDDPNAYDITKVYPASDHGTIIVTTRMPQQVHGRELRVSQLEDIQDSLAILQSRSQRGDTTTDAYAYALAERVAGLPLALATAGAYLKTSSWTYEQYQKDYERRWNVNPHISYTYLRMQQPEAAQLLKLLAYFDNQELWFGLFKAGASDDLPDWLRKIATDPVEFENLMNILASQCLIEVRTATQSYSIHAAVHDWMLAALNEEIEPSLYCYAFACVGKSINKRERSTLWYSSCSTLAMHALRLAHERLIRNPTVQIVLEKHYDDTFWTGRLLEAQSALTQAEKMFVRALVGCEKSKGQNHPDTLRLVCDLGLSYLNQHKLSEAEEMFVRMLAEKKKGLERGYVSALAARCLGKLYHKQGELVKAEDMFKQALAECEEELGHGHISTFVALSNLGALYHEQGDLLRAEEMLVSTLEGMERAAGPTNILTLGAVHSLGNLYVDQGKLDEARSMYTRELTEYEKVLAPDHPNLIPPIARLAYVYRDQGKLDQAEEMFLRAITGSEKRLGRDSARTRSLVYQLGRLYFCQKMFGQAEKMFFRALTGYEKALDSASTLSVLTDLGLAYYKQGKLDQAEETLLRAITVSEKALAGYEKALNHASTLSMLQLLGYTYYGQGELGKAEETLLRALAGYEKEQDGHSTSTFKILYGLGRVYERQGVLDNASDVFSRALNGLEKLLGPDHQRTKRAVKALERVRHQIQQQSSAAER